MKPPTRPPSVPPPTNPDHCERAVCTQVEWTSLAHINRLATETQSRITKEWIQDKLKDSRSSNIGAHSKEKTHIFDRRTSKTTNKRGIYMTAVPKT
jgi:hypothetical protein